ncbi:MAG: DUF167 domain-containing protein [bacterium]
MISTDGYTWFDKNNRFCLLIKVKPGSKKSVIMGAVEVKTVYPVNKALSISIKSQAEDNKANLELIEILAKELHLPKTSLILDKGSKNRLKVVCLDGIQL